MTESVASSIDEPNLTRRTSTDPANSNIKWWQFTALLATVFLVIVASHVDRRLPFVLSESINRDLSLSDTQIGLLTGIDFAVCYTLLSMPLARASDRGSPRFVLVSCILLWSAMTSLGGMTRVFLFRVFKRFGVAFGEAGATTLANRRIAALSEIAKPRLAPSTA